MRIYPAIDIKDGKCVRLFKGQFSDVTVYGDSPAEMAKKWESLGGEYIHVVDLDGALKGHGVNAAKIKEICESVNVPVQTGGGIRTMEDIEAKLACGIDRVIIGTKAVSDSEFVKRAVDKYGKKIVIGIDAKDGMVAIEGWEKTSDFTAVEFAKKMVNTDSIASGGVGSLDHSKSLVTTGVEGVIVGKALYTDKVDLTEAIKAVK